MTELVLLKKYKESIIPDFIDKFALKNIHEIPKLEKITINVGAGDAVQDHKIIPFIENDIKLISGQKPIVRRARKSIAGFKLRESMPIGVMVTLRGKRMYEFLDRLITIALPRVRDFKGISPKSFDGNGNYTLGVKEQLIFPEINYDKINKIRGLNITFTTTTDNDQHGRHLLEKLGLPFR